MKSIFLEHYYLYLLFYFFIFTFSIASVLYFLRSRKSPEELKSSLIVKSLIPTAILLYTFLCLEVFFAYYHVQSDGFGFTLSANRWFVKYWKPINSLGFRDIEPSSKNNRAYIIGDSFVAGHGIKKIEDRYSNILNHKLREEWSVVNLGKNGWGLPEYYKAFKEHVKSSDKVIISYFLNDISSAAANCNIPRVGIETNSVSWLRFIIARSYFLDWLYWKVMRGQLVSNNYNTNIHDTFKNEKVWKTHSEEFREIFKLAKQLNVDLAFIIWPSLNDLERSKKITSKVSRFITSEGFSAINLSEYLDGYSTKELTVNPLDSHPNVFANKLVADLIYREFFHKKN